MYGCRRNLRATTRHEKKKVWKRIARRLLSGAENAHVEGERKDAGAHLAYVQLSLREARPLGHTNDRNATAVHK